MSPSPLAAAALGLIPLAIALVGLSLPNDVNAQPSRPSAGPVRQLQGPLRVSPFTHGSWTRRGGDYGGPNYVFTACSASCDIVGLPGQSINLTIELWGAGGGGADAGDVPGQNISVSQGGAGGGGGGGYARRQVEIVIPPNSGKVLFNIKVGRGGIDELSDPSLIHGASSEVSSSNGGVLISATGGRGGSRPSGNSPGAGGAAGNGTHDSWAGTSGRSGGIGNTCNGGPRGAGGAGGGPGRTGPGYVNDGGDGGHGDSAHLIRCQYTDTTGGNGGKWGGHGKAVLTW